MKYIPQNNIPIGNKDLNKLSSNSSINSTDTFEIRYTLRKDVNPENERLCEKILQSEKDYIALLKSKQEQFIKENNDIMVSSKYNTNLTQGHFYYLISNFTKASSNETDDTEMNEVDEKEDENEETKEIILGGQ